MVSAFNDRRGGNEGHLCITAKVGKVIIRAGGLTAPNGNYTVVFADGTLTIDERGLHMEADLGGTQAGRELYEEIDGGYVDKMSFSFSVRESKYDSVTHTRTITKVKKLYDVSAVDIPAYKDTEISARSFFEVEHSKELAALEQAARRKRLVALTY